MKDGGRVSHSFNYVQYVKTFPGWGSEGGVVSPMNRCEPVALLPQSPVVITHNPRVHYVDVICCLWAGETSRVI